MEIVVRREHVKDFLIVNLDETASYYLSWDVLLKDVMQYSRNDTFINRFGDCLHNPLRGLPMDRRILPILAIFHHYMGHNLKPIYIFWFALGFGVIFIKPFKWVLRCMSSKHCVRFSRTSLTVTKHSTVKTVIKVRHDWCDYSVKNF